MGVPIIPLIGAGLQAGGLIASILSQKDAEEELQRQAEQRAQQAAWTNLISVAGGGGPVTVPDPTTGVASSDLGRIGQIAGGLGQIAGGVNDAFVQQEQLESARVNDALQQAASLAGLGIQPVSAPGAEHLEPDLISQLGTLAEQTQKKNEFLFEKAKTDLKNIGQFTPAQQKDIASSFGINTFGKSIEDILAELSAIGEKTLQQKEALDGFVDPNSPYADVGRMNKAVKELPLAKDQQARVDRGLLSETTDPGLDPIVYETSKRNAELAKADLEIKQAKARETLTPGGIEAMEYPQLISLHGQLTKSLNDGRPDKMAISMAKASGDKRFMDENGKHLPDKEIADMLTVDASAMPALRPYYERMIELIAAKLGGAVGINTGSAVSGPSGVAPTGRDPRDTEGLF